MANRRKGPAGRHAPALWRRLYEQMRGRRQRLVRPPDPLPLLLLHYPPRGETAALELEAVFSRLLPALHSRLTDTYQDVLLRLPSVIVVEMRPWNLCSCLGHHHPPGTESRQTRRLALELGSAVGEVDVAWEGIADWRPYPLSNLAAGIADADLGRIHFQSALLSVLLHEFEHLVFPERGERQVRDRSNALYRDLMRELVRSEFGVAYGVADSLLWK